MKIIVDAMGGDNAPSEIVKGTVEAVIEYNIDVILIGKENMINDELKKYDYPNEKIEVINADEIITNEDDPAVAIRRKKDASIVVASRTLNEGKAQGLISAGSTGALLASGLFIVKRIDGIDRAALTVVYPALNKLSLLVDAGANVDSKPEYLYQFALMGSIYMEKVLGIKNPTVGLVNIGSEKGKGNLLTKQTYELLEKSNLNFVGNVEARDLPEGKVDVIVCDGFVGNIILKLTEGMASSIFSVLKEEFTKDFKSKIGASILSPALKNIKSKMDYREYGGAPLLGTKKPMFKAHGSSDAFAIKNGIGQLIKFIENDVINVIEKNIELNKKMEE